MKPVRDLYEAAYVLEQRRRREVNYCLRWRDARWFMGWKAPVITEPPAHAVCSYGRLLGGFDLDHPPLPTARSKGGTP